MSEERIYPFSPSSVRAARHFVADQLESRPEEVVDAVTLIVSELTTNAIRHARTGFSIDVAIDSGHVRVAITDDGGGQPTPSNPRLTDASGRGLQIVQHLADQWGITPSSSGIGKTVWFTLALDGAAPATGDLSTAVASPGTAEHVRPRPARTAAVDGVQKWTTGWKVMWITLNIS